MDAVDAEAMLGNIDLICAPLKNLASAWQSMPVEFQRRFQLMALPHGYVFGSVRTAPKGRLFSLLMPSSTSKSNWVPHAGQSWNQLVNDIRQFADMFRELAFGPPAA